MSAVLIEVQSRPLKGERHRDMWHNENCPRVDTVVFPGAVSVVMKPSPADDNPEQVQDATLVQITLQSGALIAHCSICGEPVEIFPWTIRAHHETHALVYGQGVLW
jgi:hypothetical protein